MGECDTLLGGVLPHMHTHVHAGVCMRITHAVCVAPHTVCATHCCSPLLSPLLRRGVEESESSTVRSYYGTKD